MAQVVRYLISMGSNSLEWEAAHGYQPLSLIESKTRCARRADLVPVQQTARVHGRALNPLSDQFLRTKHITDRHTEP